MRHVILTCKNHPELRWSCKSTAYSPGYGYNGSRNIFFMGSTERDNPQTLYGIADECKCPPSILILAPEDEWSKLSEEQQREAIAND